MCIRDSLHVGGGSPGRPHPEQAGLPEVKAVRGDKVLCPHAGTGYHVPRKAEGLPAAGPKLAVEQRKALLAAEGTGLYAQLSVVAEDIGLYTLQPWPGGLDTGGVDAEGDVLGADDAVVALGDLAFQHPCVLVPDAVVLVVLGRDIDAVPALRTGTVVDKGKLVRKRGVKVVEKAAVAVKNNTLVLRRGHGLSLIHIWPAPTTEHTPNAEEATTPEAGQDAAGPMPPRDTEGEADSGSGSDDLSGGPRPGGPAPRSFFETISWRGKLSPSNPSHQGLLYAINELYGLSSQNCGRQKAYRTFSIATGMVLRTVYEQALRLRLTQVGLWGTYMQGITRGFPTLSSMEDFICAGANKPVVFPDQGLLLAYDRVIAATHREFLNANIHYPGNINVTADSLEAIAAGGMFSVIQGIINLL